MALANYSDLKTAIADWMVRDDLTAYLDDFIDLAEEWFQRPPRRPDDPEIGGLRVEITEATGNLTTGQAYISKPSDFQAPIRFDLTGTTGGRIEYIGSDAPPIKFIEGNGMPHFWTVTNVIEFDRAPDTTYAYSLKYYSTPDALSASNTTNTVLTNYPSVYLAATLHHACVFTKDEEMAAAWAARYRVAAHGANQTFRQGMVTEGSLAAQTDLWSGAM